MNRLILHPTQLSQWYALVNEAQASTRLILNEHMESYLVFLLMRFLQNNKLMESIISVDFLEALKKPRYQQIEFLKIIGDKSLLFCGLFPGIAKKRRTSISYFSDLGQAAYLSVGELDSHESASLYFQLSAKFPVLQQILQAIRGEFIQFSTINSGVLSAIELPLQ